MVNNKNINMENLHTIKSRFVSRKVGKEVVIVPLVDNVAQMNKVFTLNETAGFLWENLNEGITAEKLQELLLENFDVDAATAEKDVQTFLEKISGLKD